MTKLLIIGIDAATWSVIKPNLGELPNFKKLMEEGKYKTLVVKEPLLSASLWCTIFSGKTFKEHGHKKFIVDGKLQTRKNIKVNFIWDILNKKYDIRALQIPFVMPPYNFNCEYLPVEYGASSDLNDLERDTEGLLFKSLEILKENPDIFIVVFGALDKIQHFHWGEPLIIGWYRKMDQILGILTKYGEKIIVLSDHGFCSRGKARVQTLPETNIKGKPIKGDHHQEAILITKNIKYEIKEQKDIFKAILFEMNLKEKK